MKKRENWFLSVRFRRIVQVSLGLLFVLTVLILITEEKQIDSKKIKHLESIENVNKKDIPIYLEESKDLDLPQKEREGIVEYRLKYDRFEELLVLSELEKLEFILIMSKEESMVEQEKHYLNELVTDYNSNVLKDGINKIVNRDFPESLSDYEKEVVSIFNGILKEVNKYPDTLNDYLLDEDEWEKNQYNLTEYRKKLNVLYDKYEKVDGDFILGDIIILTNGITR